MRKALVILALLAGPAAAQQGDPMELQRCVWRCLADSYGASDPRYHACVDRVCVGIDEGPSQTPVPGAWITGIATDGFSRYAGVQAPDGSGRGLFYMCTPGGLSYLALFGLDGMGGTLRFRIDAVDYLVPFDRSRGELTMTMPPRSPFMTTLGQGGRLGVLTEAGQPLMEVSLAGAGGAMATAVAACF